MNKLEEIKDSLRVATVTGWDPEKSNYIEDITYLLSIIEQAEKALESVANAPARETMRRYAEEGLKVIRGDE